MSNKLYVGNLDYNVTQQQLEELFAPAGKVVSAVVITDKYSGRSKGFGFIEMSDEKEELRKLIMLISELRAKDEERYEAHVKRS